MVQLLPRNHIFRPNSELDAELLRRAREVIEKAKAVLTIPLPSTFLGNPQDFEEDAER
jgi:hypothetical protein